MNTDVIEPVETNPAVAVAKELQAEDSDYVTLVTGVRAKLTPVSMSVITDAQSRIKDPAVPMQPNPDKEGRPEPNPLDPEYNAALQQATVKRTQAMMDCCVMFGIQLVDNSWLETKSVWLKKLRMSEKIGLIDLSPYDLEDEIDLEFVYKKYLCLDNELIDRISGMSVVSAAEVGKAEKGFRRYPRK